MLVFQSFIQEVMLRRSQQAALKPVSRRSWQSSDVMFGVVDGTEDGAEAAAAVVDWGVREVDSGAGATVARALFREMKVSIKADREMRPFEGFIGNISSIDRARNERRIGR